MNEEPERGPGVGNREALIDPALAGFLVGTVGRDHRLIVAAEDAKCIIAILHVPAR